MLKTGRRRQAFYHSARVIQAMWERIVPERSEAREHAENISKFTTAFESAIRKFAHVSRKSQAHKIQKIYIALRVMQQNHITLSAFARPQRFNRMFDPVCGEIAQERISCAQRQEAESRTSVRERLRK